jgi:hypothetical protein
VDPTRLELVTSAMRRQHEEFAVVRLCSEMPANKHIHSKLLSSMFAVVRLGWCQVGVNRNVREAPEAVNLHFVVAPERRRSYLWLDGFFCP